MIAMPKILAQSSLGARFSNGVFWAIVGTAISQSIGLIASIISARILGKVQFGEFGIIQSTIGMYGVFAGLWLGVGATKFIAELKHDSPNRAGHIIGLSFIIAVVSSLVVSLTIIFFSSYITRSVLNAPHLETELRFVAGIIVLNVMDGVQVGALSGFEAFRAIARTGVIRSIVAFPVTVLLLWLWGLNGAILSLAVIGVLNLWINHRALKSECKRFNVVVSYKGTTSELRPFLSFSTPALLGSVLGAPVLWIANALLVNQPNGYAEMGVYSIANTWKTAVMFIPRKFISVALPMMSAEVNKDATDSKYDAVFNYTQSFSILVVVPLVTFLICASHLIVKMYGEKFADAHVVLIGVLLATGISALGSGIGPAVQASGKMWFGLFTNILWSGTFLLFTWLFVPYWGAKALVFGMALAYSVNVIYTIFAMRRELPKGVMTRVVGSIILFCLVTIPAIYMDELYLNLVMLPLTVVTSILAFFFLISPSIRDKFIQFYNIRMARKA